MQMFTFVDLFRCFSTSMINQATRDDSNSSGNESSATAGRWPPCRSYDVIADHENISVNKSSQNRGRTVIEVSLCLSRQCASTDMQYDLPGSIIRSGHLTWPDLIRSWWRRAHDPALFTPERQSHWHHACNLLKTMCWTVIFSAFESPTQSVPVLWLEAFRIARKNKQQTPWPEKGVRSAYIPQRWSLCEVLSHVTTVACEWADNRP